MGARAKEAGEGRPAVSLSLQPHALKDHIF